LGEDGARWVWGENRVWEPGKTMGFHVDATEFGKGCTCVFQKMLSLLPSSTF
jgi:hypothetical protein